MDRRQQIADYRSPLTTTDYGPPLDIHGATGFMARHDHRTAEGVVQTARAERQTLRVRVGDRTREGIRRHGRAPVDPRQASKKEATVS